MAGLRDVVFTVRPEEGGERLDRMLARRLRSLSRQQVQRLIRDRLRPLEGASRALKPSSVVRAGWRFAVETELYDEPPVPPLPVIYEDDALLVIDKPAGLAIHPAGRHYACTVTGALAARPGPRADPAHRLDRETSGLLLCGKGTGATAALKRAFRLGTVGKTYQAIAWGWPTKERFQVDLPLALGEGEVRVQMTVCADERGKPAQTDVRVKGRFRDATGERFSLLSCQPRTGRQHQIRVHLAAAGHPVVGDKIYGGDATIFIRFTEGKLDAADRAKLRLERHALHAAEVQLSHPLTGEPLQLRSPLPPDLDSFLGGLSRAD